MSREPAPLWLAGCTAPAGQPDSLHVHVLRAQWLRGTHGPDPLTVESHPCGGGRPGAQDFAGVH